MTDFETAAALFGGLLMFGALISGLVHRSFLALTAIFVLIGFVLGKGALGVLELDAGSGFVEILAITALIVILFRDGLEVEEEMLRTAWHLPLRKLVLAMPITALIVALTAKALLDVSWTEAFLLGALLSPTDPVLSSGVVTNPRVPRVIRHSLNLESGMNDGLALAPVLALIAVLQAQDGDFVWWEFVLQDIGVGLAFGLVIGLVASVLLPSSDRLADGVPPHQRALYALGVAFLTYGTTVLPPHGNGLIAVFVCAIVFGIRRPDIGRVFAERAEDVVEIVKLGIFIVFGSLLTLSGLFGDGLAAVAIVLVTLLVARPVAVWLALAGTRVDAATKLFMAWFGPKGVATMTFALLVLAEGFDASSRLFNLAALVVFVSTIAHGLSDQPGVDWIARRSAEREETRARLEALRVPDEDADGGDDDAAERDLDQRRAQRHLEELLADPRDRDELDAHDDVRDGQRGADVVDEERQRVRGAADERRDAGDHAARERRAAAGDLAVVRQPLGHAHADRGAERGGQADEQRGARAGDVGGREDRRERRDRAVDEADERRLDDLQQALALVGGAPSRPERGGGGVHSRSLYPLTCNKETLRCGE